jgi:tRNA (guanine9-N1)-methyltransferase
MHSQLMFMYSRNRVAARPYGGILHTSFSPEASPRLWQGMTGMGWERWSRCFWWGQSVEELANVMSQDQDKNVESDVKVEDTASVKIGLKDNGEGGSDPRRPLSGPKLPPGWEKHKLVYLSADADEELETLAEDEVYIIGGLVDRNRYKVSYTE